LTSIDEICFSEEFRRFICHPAIIKLLFNTDGRDSPTKRVLVYQTAEPNVDAILQRLTTVSRAEPSVFSHNARTMDIYDLTDDGTLQSQTEPLVDLFIEVFELKGLRRQAVVTILQHFFGDTFERRVLETLNDTLTKNRLEEFFETIKKTYWPNGTFKYRFEERTADTKQRAKYEAKDITMIALPEILGGVVGRQNARRGAFKIWSMFQKPNFE
jgi:hypothetical protein